MWSVEWDTRQVIDIMRRVSVNPTFFHKEIVVVVVPVLIVNEIFLSIVKRFVKKYELEWILKVVISVLYNGGQKSNPLTPEISSDSIM